MASTDTNVPQALLSLIPSNPPKPIPFNATAHLAYKAPATIHSMASVSLAHRPQISSTAVSTPFPLFTPDAVAQMRAEVLSRPVFENYRYSSNLAACQLRGFAEKEAPFVWQAWNSKEVLEIVSKVAGVELVPAMGFEVGHVNIMVTKGAEKGSSGRSVAGSESYGERDGSSVVSNKVKDDNTGMPVVDWHTDAYPFVCVLMLSDCADMVGGETALRTGTGEIMKVRGPTMGHAVVLQGRYIEHMAMKAVGGKERITMVTSFRPKDFRMKDDTVLTTVRPVSDLGQLYGQYATYRLDILQKRMDEQMAKIQSRQRAGKTFETKAVKAFLTEQIDFIESMLAQLVDDEDVVAGLTGSSHLISVDLKGESENKAKEYVSDYGEKTMWWKSAHF